MALFRGYSLLLVFVSMWMFEEKGQKLADRLAFLRGMAKWHIERGAVAVSSAFSETPNIALFFQIIEDALHCPFGNTDNDSNFSRCDMVVLRYTQKDLSVVG